MGFFEELGDATDKAVNLLVADEIVCKLISCNNSDALYVDPITDPKSLVMSKIFPLPKVPAPNEAAASFINVYFDDFSQLASNKGFRAELLTFDVMVHLDLWKLDNGYRVYSIMERIDKIFNDQYYKEIAGNKLQPAGTSKCIQFTDNFYGYVMQYRAINDSNTGKR